MHCFGENILQIENRPFKDIESMNEAIINKINSVVQADSILYIVGDFIDSTKPTDADDILSQLNGEVHLIAGNHDVYLKEYYKDKLGWRYHEKPIILDEFWIISHKPQFVSMNSPYVNIFAHVHQNPMYKTVSPRSFCVSADRHCFYPVSFEEIKAKVLTANE